MSPQQVDPNANQDAAGYPIRGIQDHALIGNLRTAAVVSTDGCIESMCIPYFDSPSVFARILDADKGGHFGLAPTWPFRPKQAYAPNSNILTTKFLSDEGVGLVTDLLVPKGANRTGSQSETFLPWLIRKVESIRGTVPFRMECAPAFNYCRDKHTAEVSDDTDLADIRLSRMTRCQGMMIMPGKVFSGLPVSPSICDTSHGLKTGAMTTRRLS